ncbi:MAG: Fic family protein [Sedimenticola sp.]
MWQPKYSIHNQLLRTIREIGEALGTIRSQSLSRSKLASLELEARTISSYASTSIEGNPLPLTDVKRLIKRSPKQVRDTEREVLNYNRALKWVQEEVRKNRFKPDTKTFELLQGIAVEGLMDNAFDVGNIRKKPVVIRNPRSIDDIVFMPPDHGDVEALCKELFSFIQENLSELDPILLAGIFHKQAVIIHPFMDGNGRSTRLMTTGIMGMAGLDIFSIFSFEAYYNQNITRYFKMVGETGDYYDIQNSIDYSNWLDYFADGILDELKRVQKSLPEKQLARLASHHQVILDYIEANGSITQREYGEISDRSLAARKKDLIKLIELGLIEKQGGGRSVYYVISQP